MRIIAGKYSGIPFHPPKNIKARPTTDRAKEALFNTLSHQVEIEGAEVLDLFSGTGNIAYEFASRGAGRISCVDISPVSIKFIKETMEKLKFDDFKTYKSPVLNFLKKTDQQFDVIFADPPYAMPEIPQIAELVFEKELLKDNGILIIEHFKSLTFNQKEQYDRREYGQSVFSYFKK